MTYSLVLANGEKICAKKTFYSPQVPRKVITTIHPAFYHQVRYSPYNFVFDTFSDSHC